MSSGPTASPNCEGDIQEESLAVSFARAIAKPGSPALLINSDNSFRGRCSLEEATRGGSAYAVEVQDDVFAVDADTPAAARYLEETLMPFLTANNIRPVLVGSGGPGRLHLFARIPDPELLRTFTTLSRQARCDVRTVIRPPLAPHRSGLRTELLVPTDPADALSRLTASAANSRQPNAIEHKRRSLSAHIFNLIRNGDTTGRYNSRSEVIMAIALGAVNASLPMESLWKMLIEANHRGGERVQEILKNRGERAARRYLTREYTKATERAARNPPFRGRTDVIRAINRFEVATNRPENARRFIGRAGATDRAVIQGFIGVARRCGSTEFQLSLRQLGEYAGISGRRAVQASIPRLVRMGLLEVIRCPQPRKMGQYSLRSLDNHSTIGGCEENGIGSFASPGHDAWWRRKGVWRIWLALQDLTAREVAERAGITPRGAQQHLKKLREWGLAARDDQGRYHRIEQVEALENVAALRGTAGRIASLRERHRFERERWKPYESSSGPRRLVIVPDPLGDEPQGVQPQPSRVLDLQQQEPLPSDEIQRIARLDAARRARDENIGRGYDFDPSSPSHTEFVQRQEAHVQEALEVAECYSASSDNLVPTRK